MVFTEIWFQLSPLTKILTLRGISDAIPLHKGTLQGRPLAQLIFNLELLGRYLLYSTPLHGVKIGCRELCIVLFADYRMIFSVAPSADVCTLQSTLTLFCSCSDLRINYDKSEYLNTAAQPCWDESSLFPYSIIPPIWEPSSL